jgi:cardiolipin synthase
VATARIRFPLRRAKGVAYVAGNSVTLLRDGAEAYPSMLEAIGGSTEQVLVEMYWFGSDKVGRTFADALLAAASRGVEVAVIYDAVGSFGVDMRIFDELRRGGCRVVEFGPIAPWRHRFRLEGLTRRDHRKIIVVDGEIGYTGGINIGDPWLPRAEGGAGWRDDAVRVEGPAVRGLSACVLGAWRRAGGPALSRVSRSDVGPEPRQGGQKVSVLSESQLLGRRQIANAYVSELARAERRVWVTNPYFVPDRVIRRSFGKAAERGVDVRVLLPGISDVEVVRIASRATWDKLLASGVRLFEYQGAVLHAKSAVVDGRWSTVGSFNLDYRSRRSNLELNVAVLDESFAARMERSFTRDLEAAVEVRAHEFGRRSAVERALEFVAYQFRKVL